MITVENSPKEESGSTEEQPPVSSPPPVGHRHSGHSGLSKLLLSSAVLAMAALVPPSAEFYEIEGVTEPVKVRTPQDFRQKEVRDPGALVLSKWQRKRKKKSKVPGRV